MKTRYCIIKDNEIKGVLPLDENLYQRMSQNYLLVPAPNVFKEEMEWDGEKVVLKTTLVQKREQKEELIDLQKYLDSTDWLVVRKMETQVDVPQEVLTKRAEARLRISELRDLLDEN